MTGEAFRQEIRANLREHLRRYPAMEQQDVVKFVFQAMLGVGHLLSSRNAAEEAAARETESLLPGRSEALTEALSPDWCRISLRAAKDAGIPPRVIAGLMFSADAPPRYTRQDVLDFCRTLAGAGEMRLTDPAALGKIPDGGWIPSHSPAYREQYRPAYRVIPAEWIPRMEAVRRIAEAQGDRVLVTMDGPCATGKTTLAEKLAGVFDAAVVHTDDFVIPHAQKTAERLAVPGGNCDAERLSAEVAGPWKAGKSVVFRKYNFREDRLMPEEKLPDDCRILILEGSYCNLPAIRKYADVRIFLTAPWETRISRLKRRESAQSLQMFHQRWIPLEDRYFEAFGLPDPECAIIG